MQEWLKFWKHDKAQRGGQNLSKIENTLPALIELVKYGSKIFTEPDVNKKLKGTQPAYIFTSALDNILKSMEGIRIFERFGFNLPKEKITQQKGMLVLLEYETWIYDPNKSDWINLDSQLPLTNYAASAELKNLLENNVNKDLS